MIEHSHSLGTELFKKMFLQVKLKPNESSSIFLSPPESRTAVFPCLLGNKTNRLWSLKKRAALKICLLL